MMLHWGFHFHCASERRHSEWPWPLFYDTIRSMLSQVPFSRLSNTLRYKLITFITEENEREKISHFTMSYFYNSQALQSWFFPPGMASFQREFITLLHYRKITSPFCTPQSQRNKRKTMTFIWGINDSIHHGPEFRTRHYSEASFSWWCQSTG